MSQARLLFKIYSGTKYPYIKIQASCSVLVMMLIFINFCSGPKIAFHYFLNRTSKRANHLPDTCFLSPTSRKEKKIKKSQVFVLKSEMLKFPLKIRVILKYWLENYYCRYKSVWFLLQCYVYFFQSTGYSILYSAKNKIKCKIKEK